MFGEVLSIASELGAMDQKRLGNETRPEEEVAAHRSLEAIFARNYEELTRRLNVFNPALQLDVAELIEHLRTGDVDFAAEAEAALNGETTDSVERVNYLILMLIEYEFLMSTDNHEAADQGKLS